MIEVVPLKGTCVGVDLCATLSTRSKIHIHHIQILRFEYVNTRESRKETFTLQREQTVK